MKLSYSWLKEYLECGLTPQEIADAMTSIGIEVDSVSEEEKLCPEVVVAEVKECVMHPDSDHLHVTKVDDGTGELITVVCGAPNVAAGQKVLFARIGAVLPGDFKIKKSKIRGVESFGMICAEDELGIGNDHSGIKVLPADAPVGVTARDYLGLKSEAVIEYEITANRVDAASHVGVARDLYAYLKLNGIPCSFSYPDVSAFAEGEGEAIPVEVQDVDGAPEYDGITIRDVKVGPSPEWLQEKLLAIGLHPINNVVDISNFVLFELGQPLHTFDADKIAGGKVIVRRAAEGEKIVTLDGVERNLHANDMVIANAEGPMCIAGVFGGIDSGVTESTVNVFLESAYFDPGSIRKTSKSHGLQTDASFRYERGVDPGIIPLAARRAALLIQELAGGHITGKVQVNYPQPIEKKVIDLDYDRIENFIGKKIGHDVIENILTWLSYDFIEKRQGGAKVAAPSYMIDVYRECDVVEEILRIYSYNNIELPHHMKMSVGTTPVPDPETVRNYISNFLAANGFNETMNNSLTKSAYYAGLETFPEERCVRIVNPLSADLNVLRQTLILNGLEVVAYNVNRQIGTLKTFEYGSVYQRLPETDGKTLASYEEHQCFTLLMSGSPARSWREGARKGSFYELKGYLELLLKRYAVDIFTLETKPAPSDIFAEGISYSLPGTHEPLAVIGTVSPALARKFDVRQPVFAAEICWQTLLKLVSRVKVKFQEMPKFPEVRRDLAVLIDENVAYADLCRAAQKSVKKILKQVSLFDVYRGDKIPEGKKQYAINFVLQDPEKTLTDQEVEKAMSRLLATFQNQFGAVLR
ncbi:MAG: phenylalanine--tRNA ligase subunit beta [Bacteroidales bacterium]|nr:phenylalanine--tRNA ligase subunit beta [Bacteroidales bacterium]MDY2859473.1 phenylalanine--tRNA ligase subunit beta [Candidatus Cryptobacteroides sp.]MDY5442865.1 phenylalanine--tRNA ligase subunit beta [Candidatus Cryptobacteroides sp.]